MDATKLSKRRKKQFKRKIKMKLNAIIKKRARSLGIRRAIIGDKDIKFDDKGSANDKSK